MTRQLVAKVVGILYLTTGREVSHEAIDAWAVALASTSEGPDVLEVAAELARRVDFVTLAQFYKALTASRRRRALDEAAAQDRALGRGDDDVRPLSDPRAWTAFRIGAEREAARMGKPAPRLRDKAPPVGVSMTTVLRDMFRPSDPAAAWNGGGELEQGSLS
jgi:hypothetical protein